MSKITVTAAEGARAQVTVRKKVMLTREVPPVFASDGALVAPAEKREYPSFEAKEVVSFASESRTFEIGADTTLLVEEQP